MSKLILPPIPEVKDIVLDMMPTIQSDADRSTIQQSVDLAERLVSLLNGAAGNLVAEAVLKNMLRGIAADCHDIN